MPMRSSLRSEDNLSQSDGSGGSGSGSGDFDLMDGLARACAFAFGEVFR